MASADLIRAVLLAKADALVRRDSATLASLIDPGFVYVNAAGSRFDKAGYVDAFCTSGRIVFRAQTFDELEVRLFARFAVATMIVDDRFAAGGAEVVARYKSLCVFGENAAGWLWAAGQTAKVG